MSVVGFDFGTDTCIVAVCRRGGLDVLQNEVGNRKTASLVAFSGNQRFIGDSAVAQAKSNWKNTVTGFKNLLRVNSMDHPDLKHEQLFLPYKMCDNNGKLAIEVRYDFKKELLSPVQVAAAMLQQLKNTAERGLNTRVVDCVISVPPMWTETARHALLDAANVAGLNVLRLMTESAAVALTYGILRTLPPAPINVMMVDVGASHTNVSLVEFQTGKLKVLAVETDNRLGGRDFDKLLFDHFVTEIKAKYKMDITTNQKSSLKLMACANRTKMTLSANTIVPWGVEYLMNDKDCKGQITRAEFEKLAAHLSSRISPLCEKVLARAGKAKADLHSVEIVGGGTRIPALQNGIKAWYGGVLSKTCDGDESVARGCALQCAMLSPLVKVRSFDVVDTQPYAVSVEWGALASADGSSMSALEHLDAPLFAPGDSVPCVKLVSFTDRKEPFQIVASYSDPSVLPPGVTPQIGRYIVNGFPTEFTDDHPKIKVEFNLNLHGIFTVVKATLMQVKPEEKAPEPAAMDTTEDGKDAKKEAESKPMDTTDEAKKAPKKKYSRTLLTVQTVAQCGLDQKSRQGFYEKEIAMANQDRVIAETSEARDMLERYVLEMKGRIESSEDLANYITDAEKSVFHAKLQADDDWLVSDEGYDAKKSEYKSKLAELMKYGNPVVSRQFEHRERKGAVDMLKKMVAHNEAFVTATDEKWAHITAEQRAPIQTKCSEVDNWIAIELTRQDRLALNVDPILTKAMLIAKAKELDAVAKPIKSIVKPKPVEKPKEEKSTEEQKTEEPAPAASDAAAEPAPATEPEAAKMET